MVPVKLGMSEQEVIDELTQYYGEETATLRRRILQKYPTMMIFRFKRSDK